MSTAMIGDRTTGQYQTSSAARESRYLRQQRDIPKAQQTIYNHLLAIVKTWPPEDVLEEFRHLFIHHVNTSSSALLPALYEIVLANREEEFKNTLKRSCYILINNWDITRNHQSIRKLIQVFADPVVTRMTPSPTLKRLRGWLQNFIDSSDFRELRLFAARYEEFEKVHWSERYTSYLLVPQYINLQNSAEQREAARALSQNLKERFKIDLAFYTALSESTRNKSDRGQKNPTILGHESLNLIKRIVARRGPFSYENLAHIFINQTRGLNYRQFKDCLKDYLIYSLEKNACVEILNTQLSNKLIELYQSHEDKTINDALLLRTSNRVIEYLTTEDHETPSSLFLLLMSQGTPLTLVIVLLKLVLICRHVRTHLEARVADLIQYYEKFDEADCRWVISFFEIFNITMTIHAENIEYTLVSMNRGGADEPASEAGRPLSSYRIFSQAKLRERLPPEAEPDLSLIAQHLADDEDFGDRFTEIDANHP
ncbi:MAG: hypothetical protein VKK04_04010 [Synechococcales bacterium]|nr:hypothetical protein [Synechococcales bacterium]